MDWRNSIKQLLADIIENKGLPTDSLYLAGNTGKGNSTDVISYSICIYEPEYPPVKKHSDDPSRNTVITNIKEKKLKAKSEIQFQVHEIATEWVPVFDGVKDKGIVAGNWHQYSFDTNDMELLLPKFISYLDSLTNYEIRHYESKATKFGCCSRFNECSDAKECVHPNKLYGCACYYKSNLDQGKIFYGKNKNV